MTVLTGHRNLMLIVGGLAVAVAILFVAFSDHPAGANERVVNEKGAKAAATAEGLHIPAAQSQAFADDVITDEERKVAFGEWIACIEAAGFPVVDSELRYFGESIAIDDPEDRSAQVVDLCRENHYQAIAIAHRATLIAPEQAIGKIEQEVGRCLDSSDAQQLISATNDESIGEAYCRKAATDTVLGRP